ncbi:MAG: nuoL [Cyanobacteria bacterium RYN_339]|nr:nuoL [Cyanobacteria bacterium RYN_339]
MMHISALVSLVPLFPLLGAILIGLVALVSSHNERGPNKALIGLLACAGPMASCFVALELFSGLMTTPGGFAHHVYTWFTVGDLSVPVEFYADRLSGVMILIVTFVGSLIHLYSVGYMWEERGFTRFFCYLNLFTFSMLVLVLGKNVPMMFLGWEGVGTCSYLLIGYYFNDVAKAQAANKAFIVNRVGDLGLLVGLFMLYYFAQHHGVPSLDFAVLREHKEIFEHAPAIASAIGLLFFIGACGKSAQIPLHVWLADAMAGPTPVSALIHAATMVTAGVYMVARMSFIYTYAPFATEVIGTVGILTAFVAATIAITQNNIKRVLAYSTVSQLGYMFVGVASGAYAAGVFHLFTHAFFKALLFLGAGAVIHALHHEEEMDHYGGLRKKLPFTFAIMLIGCLAIAGVPPFAGFFSKDAILAAAWERGWGWIYWLGLFTSGLTAFYMFRMLVLTFFGKNRDIHHHYDHAHEGPWQMNFPLLVLAIGTCLVGFLGLPDAMGGSLFGAWLAPALTQEPAKALSEEATWAFHSTEYLLMSMAIVAGALGILVAWMKYGNGRPSFAYPKNMLLKFFRNKWFIDDIFDVVFVKGSIAFVGWGLWHVVDDFFIDGVVRALPRGYFGVANGVRRLHTGMARSYAYAMLVGALVIFYMVMTRFSLLKI